MLLQSGAWILAKAFLGQVAEVPSFPEQLAGAPFEDLIRSESRDILCSFVVLLPGSPLSQTK